MARFTILALVCLTVGCDSSQQVASPNKAAEQNVATGDVTFQFQSTDDAPVKEIVVNDVADGTTLEELMRTLDGVSVKGSGTTAFVDKIDDVQTGGSEGWTFKVDGEFAKQGVGKTILHPPTTISWRFGSFDG